MTTSAFRARFLAVALFVVAGWLAAGCDVTVGVGNDRYLERETKDFKVSGTPDVILRTFDGSIEVRAWDKQEVSVEVEKRGANKEAVDRIKVDASQNGNRVTVEVKEPEHVSTFGISRGLTARLIVSVPRESNVDVRSGDGSVTLERIKGRVQANTGDGSVRATELTGEVRVHTGDGSVRLDGVDGRVDAETSDGSVRASGRFDVARIRTGDGSIHVDLANGSKVDEDWEIRSGDGSVGLQLPQPFDAELDAHTNGDSSVALRNISVSGEISKNSVRGKLGSGGRMLRIVTGDGSITISKQ